MLQRTALLRKCIFEGSYSIRSYKLPELIRWLQARKSSHDTNVVRFDECVYTTYTYQHVDQARGLPSITPWVLERGRFPFRMEHDRAPTGDLLGVPELQQDGGLADSGLQTITEEGEVNGESGKHESTEQSQAAPRRASHLVHYTPEVFLMEYGSAYKRMMS